MVPRIAVCIPLTIALLAGPASALAANVVVPSSVADSTTVPADGSRTLTLRCPATAVALNAAVTNHDPGVTVRRSIPGSKAGTWSFRLRGEGGGGGVRAVVRCVRLQLPVGVTLPRRAVETGQRPITAPRCMTVMVCVESEMFAVSVAAEAAGVCPSASPTSAARSGSRSLFMTLRYPS